MKTRETKFGTYIEMETETSTKLTGDKITVFVERLKKIGKKNLVTPWHPSQYGVEACTEHSGLRCQLPGIPF